MVPSHGRCANWAGDESTFWAKISVGGAVRTHRPTLVAAPRPCARQVEETKTSAWRQVVRPCTSDNRCLWANTESC
jgi:hypothetical protein